MAIFKTRPIPFYQGAIDNNVNISRWAYIGFLLIYLVVSSGVGFLVSQITSNPGPSTSAGAVVGIFLSVHWFCQYFYKKQQRVMSHAEFKHYFKWLLFVSMIVQIVICVLFYGLFILGHIACETASQAECKLFNSVTVGGMGIILVVALAVTALLNAIFIRFSLKNSIRTLHKKHQTKRIQAA